MYIQLLHLQHKGPQLHGKDLLTLVMDFWGQTAPIQWIKEADEHPMRDGTTLSYMSYFLTKEEITYRYSFEMSDKTVVRQSVKV